MWRAQAETLAEGLFVGDRGALARAITLVESSLPSHHATARELMNLVVARTSVTKKETLRIGISGAPGAGKSSTIEVLGTHLLKSEPDSKIAVLAVDPSSRRTGGSLMADRTRMTELTGHERAFVRPSPSRGTLGGVTRATSDAILLCEASGYNVVVVETVGVGQSEVAVGDMTDVFVLLLSPGGGDQLQGMKRGIMEMAHVLVVNKADGSFAPAASRTKADYSSALDLVRPESPSWKPKVLLASALENKGIDHVLATIRNCEKAFKTTGELEARRGQQRHRQLWTQVDEELRARVRELAGADVGGRDRLGELEEAVKRGALASSSAADTIVSTYLKGSLLDARRGDAV